MKINRYSSIHFHRFHLDESNIYQQLMKRNKYVENQLIEKNISLQHHLLLHIYPLAETKQKNQLQNQCSGQVKWKIITNYHAIKRI